MNKTNRSTHRGTRENCAISTSPHLEQLEDEVLAVLGTRDCPSVVERAIPAELTHSILQVNTSVPHRVPPLNFRHHGRREVRGARRYERQGLGLGRIYASGHSVQAWCQSPSEQESILAGVDKVTVTPDLVCSLCSVTNHGSSSLELCTFAIALDFYSVPVAVPSLSSRGLGYANSAWLGTALLVSFALGLLVWPRLCKGLGYKFSFAVAMHTFNVGSSWAGISRTPGIRLAWRVCCWRRRRRCLRAVRCKCPPVFSARACVNDGEGLIYRSARSS